jgi:MSHA biogenesis protein MshO
MSLERRIAAGFTLVELIVAISILGILAAMGAIFIKPVIDAYVAQQTRAELTDVADTAMRRLSRDIRLALPNSVRVTSPGNIYLELLLTRTGGRYRSELGPNVGEDPLTFSAADPQFDTLGRLSTLAGQTIVAGSDRVVVHNLGISGADAYAGNNTSLIGTFTPNGGPAGNADRIAITALRFPLESPGRRFSVISGPVTYECTGVGVAGGNGTGLLRRHDGYGINPAAPVAAPTANPPILARYVSGCAINYGVLALQGRGLVAIRLVLTRSGETVSLYQEVHVSNVP